MRSERLDQGVRAMKLGKGAFTHSSRINTLARTPKDGINTLLRESNGYGTRSTNARAAGSACVRRNQKAQREGTGGWKCHSRPEDPPVVCLSFSRDTGKLARGASGMTSSEVSVLLRPERRSCCYRTGHPDSHGDDR